MSITRVIGCARPVSAPGPAKMSGGFGSFSRPRPYKDPIPGQQPRTAEWEERREYRSEMRKCLDGMVWGMLVRC